MFKNLHKHLLENYPLLWNMRLHSILGIMALVHLLHFFVGYASFTGIGNMGYSGVSGAFFSSEFAFFSFIGSFVIFIVWLMRVFRNNAFKSFYPFSNAKMYAQFLIFFLVCFFNTTYYISYTLGYAAHGRMVTDAAANKKDSELLQTMLPFLQQSKEQFEISHRCTPSPFPVVKRYNNNAVQENDDYVEESASTNFQNNEDKSTYYYKGSDGKNYSPEQVEAMVGGHFFSYLNYCYYNTYDYDVDRYDYDDAQKSNYTSSQIAILNNPQELKAKMKAFVALCDKYKIRYKIDVEEWFRWVYNPPYFPVQYTIKNTYYNEYADESDEIEVEAVPAPYDDVSNAESEVNPKGYYVQLERLKDIVRNTTALRRFHLDFGVVLGFLIAAVFMAVLLFTYRVTTKRVWLTSFIGSALLSMILGAFTAVIASSFGGLDGGVSIMIFYLLVIIAFLFVYFLVPKKTISGVALNWFTWSAGFIVPLVYSILLFSERYEMKNLQETLEKRAPLLYWIEHNVVLSFSICLVIYLVGLVFIMPLYRRWQAMPED